MTRWHVTHGIPDTDTHIYSVPVSLTLSVLHNKRTKEFHGDPTWSTTPRSPTCPTPPTTTLNQSESRKLREQVQSLIKDERQRNKKLSRDCEDHNLSREEHKMTVIRWTVDQQDGVKGESLKLSRMVLDSLSLRTRSGTETRKWVRNVGLVTCAMLGAY